MAVRKKSDGREGDSQRRVMEMREWRWKEEWGWMQRMDAKAKRKASNPNCDDEYSRHVV